MNDRETNAELTWPESSGPVHAQLDSTASCSICNDFYNTPLVLPCGHSFCSNCIRSYVSHQQGQAKCPQCRAGCDERDLRPNTALRDLVDKLLQARPAYIAALRSHKAGYSRLVKASTEDTAPGTSSNKRQLRSSRTASTPAPVSPTLEDAADLQVSESPRKRLRLDSGNSAAASSSAPASAKSKTLAPSTADVAACPICNRTFKAGRVLEAHVNRCIDNPPTPAQDAPVPEQPRLHTQKPLQRKPQKEVPQVKVPAKIAFHLFNDKKLRDKLKDVNLPVTGKRKELEDRYNRLRLEVQLAADRGEAASEAELVRRTMAKEKTALTGKGFFGAPRGATKGGALDADLDIPDMPEEDFASFAALIRATKERDAARKAKQRQAQTAEPQADTCHAEAQAEAAARAALPQASDQTWDVGVAVEAATEHAGRQPADSVTQLAACPVGLQPSDQLQAALPPDSIPSGTCHTRHACQDVSGDANIGSRHVVAANSALTVPTDEQYGVHQGLPAEAQHRVDLTLGDSPSKLSQESLAVEVEDDASPVLSQKVQDQRALQQLQLLSNSKEPVSVSGACNSKSMHLSQGKDLAVSSVPYQNVGAHLGRTKDCLGPLDDIIEDTDSDLEALLQ